MALAASTNKGCIGTPLKGFIGVNVTGTNNTQISIRLKLGDTTVATYIDPDTLNSASWTFDLLENSTYTVEVSSSDSGETVIYGGEGSEIIIDCNPNPCDLSLDSATVINDVNSQGNGKILVGATSSYDIEYSVNGVDFQDSSELTGLPAGSYTVYVRDANGCSDFQYSVNVGNLACNLAIDTFEKTDETGLGLNDGTATIFASSQSTGIQYKINGGAYQSSGEFTGLAPGAHIITVRDSSNCLVTQEFTIVGVVLPPEGYLHVPINSLRFVPSVTPDNCSVFQTFDNTLFASEVYPGHDSKCYYQKVAKCDELRIQWESNYSDNYIELTNIYTAAVFTFEGNAIVAEDLPEGYEFPTEYNIIEGVINWVSVPNGYYSIKIKAEDDEIDSQEWPGEPIHLATTHPDTSLITFKNFDQAFGVEYQTGITHKIRVISRFFERTNPGKRVGYEDGLERFRKLSGSVKRKVKLELFLLPPYLHELLSIAFEHDYFTVNGVEFQSEDNYTIKYFNRFNLANGEVDLTQVDFFNKNANDIGSSSTNTGFLEVENEGLLKL